MRYARTITFGLAYRKRYNSSANEMELPTMHDSRKPLWINVSLLMQRQYGTENLNRLAREAKVSPATASRLKAQQTSVGLETIDRLAEYFGVQPHELIDPGYEHANKHDSVSPLAADLAQALDSIKDPVQHQRAYALALQLIEFGQMSRNATNQAARQATHGTKTDGGDKALLRVDAPSPEPSRGQ